MNDENLKSALRILAAHAAYLGANILDTDGDVLNEALAGCVDVTAEAVAKLTGWQPIETAPMNKRVLVVSDYGEVIIATRVTSGWSIEGTVHSEPVMGLFVITHWMPLPVPPEVSK